MAKVLMIAHLWQFDAWYLGTYHIREQQWFKTSQAYSPEP